VITKAIIRQLSWVQASEILGISARHMRRLRYKVERWGMSAVMDQRGGRPRRNVIVLDRCLELVEQSFYASATVLALSVHQTQTWQ